MKEMKSKYNVFFYGICFNPNLCLIMENCERGTLYDCLNSKLQLSWFDLNNFHFIIYINYFYIKGDVDLKYF